MSLILLALIIIVGLLAHGMVKTARHGIEKHGLGVLLWRHITGNYYLHPGHQRPPRKRIIHAAWRDGAAGAFASGYWGWMHYRPIVLGCLGVIAAALGWLTWRQAKRGAAIITGHRRYVRPLHDRLTHTMEIDLPPRARDWLHVEPGHSKVVLRLPPDFDGSDEALCHKVVATTATCLALDTPEVAWRKHGNKPTLILTRSQPPPTLVGPGTVKAALAALPDSELFIATGRRNTAINWSLTADSPHMGLSIGTGGGKSATSRLLLAQHLHRGGWAVILDLNMSHPWARNHPGVLYADTPQEIHGALTQLGAELEHRFQRIKQDADPGCRIMVLFEEVNSTVPMLRTLWQQTRGKEDQRHSPALEAWDNILCRGRAPRMNAICVAQMLTVKAAGSSAARENMGVRLLSRYTFNNWRMIAPEHPMPPKPTAPGRIQVVTSDVREGQAGYLENHEAAEIADVPAPPIALQAADQPKRLTIPETGTLVSLAQAQRQGIFGNLGYETIRKRLQRANGTAPVPVSGGKYDPDDLRRWHENDG